MDGQVKGGGGGGKGGGEGGEGGGVKGIPIEKNVGAFEFCK